MSPFSTTVRGSSPRRNVARDGGGGSGGLDIVTPEHTQNARRAVHPVSTASCIRLLTVRGSLWTRSVTPVDDLPSTVAGVDAVPGSATHRERETGDRGVDRGDDRAQVGRQRLGDPQQQLAQLVAASVRSSTCSSSVARTRAARVATDTCRISPASPRPSTAALARHLP